MLAALARRLDAPVRNMEAVGWDGDSLEAQAFAYLAVRSRVGLPVSLPSTTSVARPTAGGRLFSAPGTTAISVEKSNRSATTPEPTPPPPDR
jgi:anhydro-N-acetylmuramic acid kinase